MSETLDLIESRVAKLEELVGKSESLNDANCLALLGDLSGKVSNFVGTNPNLAAAVRSINDIKKYAKFDVFNDVEDEQFLNAKVELILEEENYLKTLSSDFETLQKLTGVLDNQGLNEVPKLTEKLNAIAARQVELKLTEEQQADELKEFLGVYYSTMKTIAETTAELSDFLDQFDKKA